MLGLLTRCPACAEAPEVSSFPLCPPCLSSLIPCPPLCPDCAQPGCEGAGSAGLCPKPWTRSRDISSYSAAWLLAGPGYRVLKRWKTGGGRLFDRHALGQPGPESLRRLRDLEASAVIPIPQRLARSWRLGRSPAFEVAKRLSSLLEVPLVHALECGGTRSHRQAELGNHSRRENRLHFEVRETDTLTSGSTILLIDDFMTTGHTFRAAARSLQGQCHFRIHAFCLGIRPQRIFVSRSGGL